MEETKAEKEIVKDNVASTLRRMLNKVPEVTIFFWLIKILATTVGETAADLLNENLHLGLTVTTYVMSGLLLVSLFIQFKEKKYVPGVYWLTVVLISIVGTLFSDNLVDNMGVPLKTTTIAFSIALITTFVVWYINERTLSIHSIYTSRREAYYWAAILFTFALGTSAGDLISEGLNVGYWKSALMFASGIGIVAIAYFVLEINEVSSFWIAYILTRPLGASIGDFMSQPRHSGGLNLGTVGTSAIFLTVILGIVIYLSRSKRDFTHLSHEV